MERGLLKGEGRRLRGSTPLEEAQGLGVTLILPLLPGCLEQLTYEFISQSAESHQTPPRGWGGACHLVSLSVSRSLPVPGASALGPALPSARRVTLGKSLHLSGSQVLCKYNKRIGLHGLSGPSQL